MKTNKKIKFVIPILALILIFSFALACNGERKERNLDDEKETRQADISTAMEEVAAEETHVAEEEESSPTEQTTELEGENNAIPVGTYKGETDIPEIWSGFGLSFPGHVIYNEIVVIVAEDGTVTGTLCVTRIGDARPVPLADGTTSDYTVCTDYFCSGDLSGHLTDVDGTITIKMTDSSKISYHGGSWDSVKPIHIEDFRDLHADIHISDYDMYGNVPDFHTGFTFKALKD